MASTYKSFRNQLSSENILNTSTSQMRTRKGSFHLYKQQKLNNTSLTNIQPRSQKMTRNISQGDIRATFRRNPEVPAGPKYNFRQDYEMGLNSSILDEHSYDLKQKQPQKLLRRYEKEGKFQSDSNELKQQLRNKRYEMDPMSSENKYISQMEGFKVERRPYLQPISKSPGKIVQVANRNKSEFNKTLTPQIQQFSLGERPQYYGRIDRKQLLENPSTPNLRYESNHKFTQYGRSGNADKSDLYERIENYQKKYLQRQRNLGYVKQVQLGNQLVQKKQYIKPSQSLTNFKNNFQAKYPSENKFNNTLKLRDQNLQAFMKKNKEKVSLQKDYPQQRYNYENSYKKKDHFHSYNRQSGEVSYKDLYQKMSTIPLRAKQNNRDFEMQRAKVLNQTGKGLHNYSKDRKDGYQKKSNQSWNNLNKQSHQQRFSRLNDYENRLYDQPQRQRIQSTADLKIPHKHPYIQSMKSSKIHQNNQQHKFEDYLPREHINKDQQFGAKNNRFNREDSYQVPLMNHPEYNCVNRIEALNNKINSKFHSLKSVYQH